MNRLSIHDSPTLERRVSQIPADANGSQSSPSTQPPLGPFFRLGDGYPLRTGITGSMTHFVAWCPQTSGVTTSTQTVLHWQIITGYFTTGLLDKTTSIDLDEKNKSTTVRVIPPVSNSSKARVISPGQEVNHNKPDWVITYYALRPIRITRVCMVLEAKGALEWKTVSFDDCSPHVSFAARLPLADSLLPRIFPGHDSDHRLSDEISHDGRLHYGSSRRRDRVAFPLLGRIAGERQTSLHGRQEIALVKIKASFVDDMESCQQGHEAEYG